MSRYRTATFVCLLLSVPILHAAQVRLKVEGLEGKLEQNVRANLSTISNDEVSNDERSRARINAAILKGLRALGYYHPTIKFGFQNHNPPDRPLLIAHVSKGSPVLLSGIDVKLRGEAQQDEDYQKLLHQMPKLGTVLNHGDYDGFKNSLTSLAVRKGYFDADMPVHQLGVIADEDKAFWNIEMDSGQRYRFGNTVFTDSQIREEYLRGLLPFYQGEHYSAEKLAKLNQNLSATGWFNSVVVSPNFKQTSAKKELPLDVVVTPRSRNSVDLGGGYATDVGPRVKASWKKPWLNEYGHSFTSSVSLSAPEQELGFEYKIPLVENPLDHYYTLQGGFQRTDLNDTKSSSAMLNGARHWVFDNGWHAAANLRWTLDHFTQAEERYTTMLLYPGAMLSRTRSRGGAMPTWGDSQRYSVDWSNTTWGSGIDFISLQAQNTWIRSWAEKHRFVTRGNIGWLETGDFKKVPPSLRFFAGGDRSIRGYKYKSISPKDNKHKLIGASRMITGSLEYQYNVTGKWWGATFIDSGEAVNNIKHSNYHTGAGVGVRWESPVGPIKFDLAMPIGDDKHHRLQFYIGLGPEL